MPKIAVARLWFEGNSFTPTPTGMDAFLSREWITGNAVLERYAGTAMEMGAVAAFLAARPDWSATVLRCASAQPGGAMANEVMDAWMGEVIPALSGGGFDGVYLSLHGACVTQSDPEADLTILRAVRTAVGRDVPVTASFDFHADMAEEAAALLDGASAYRTYPHVDMDVAGARALAMLERRILGGPAMHGAVVKRPFVLQSLNMRSAEGPMAEVWALAAELEEGAVCEAFPFGGFAWGDSPHAGPSGMAWASDAGAARAAAERIAEAIEARRARFTVSSPMPEEAVARALEGPPGLVAVLDPADNPFSGGIADTPGLLRVLVENPPPVPTVFAFLNDPAAVQAAIAAGEGGRFERALGGQVTDAFGPPVPFSGVVERLTDGRFVNEGPMERGSPVDLGPTAVLRAGGFRVILTTKKEAAVDPAFFSLHGIDLGATRLMANKGKNHFRAAFAERCSLILECDCPGPASLDLTALPFRHVPASWLISA
ncbi:M81 family metallopeptidase [Roseomonas xinghualingensis]|uniref:M81 family metallopeptidase n=1 Tax=Roseomonas xinghualingensis TaxID=2986475 RepID=UPI0021F1A043|nr:M81 family metallopeptidase [Roseomonas sp. SXEYE001]MCV4208005.1 M81 family metallopeptidase [Roseomonas sp. SXEYE001]